MADGQIITKDAVFCEWVEHKLGNRKGQGGSCGQGAGDGRVRGWWTALPKGREDEEGNEELFKIPEMGGKGRQ